MQWEKTDYVPVPPPVELAGNVRHKASGACKLTVLCVCMCVCLNDNYLRSAVICPALIGGDIGAMSSA